METLQKPARWDHPTPPSVVRSVVIATGRSEGDIVIRGVGGGLGGIGMASARLGGLRALFLAFFAGLEEEKKLRKRNGS